MPRKLRTFTTSAGFFDLAVAAPSMKAALEAWGSKRNLFHHGFAKQNDDPKIVAATMAKPGMVLRRPVGTNGAFREHAELPKHLGGDAARPGRVKRPVAASKTVTKPVDEAAAHAAAQAFVKEQKRRERQDREEEAARARQRQSRDRAIAASDAALEKARQAHETRVKAIAKARAALDRKSEVEQARWNKEREELESARREARSSTPLRLV